MPQQLYRLVDEHRRPVALVQAETGRQARQHFLEDLARRASPQTDAERLMVGEHLRRLSERLESERWS
jgi:hypothetical protein